MDPDATFALITSAYAERDWEEAAYACDDLIAWLEKGGSLPEKLALTAKLLSTPDRPIAALATLRDLREFALEKFATLHRHGEG